MTIVNLNLKNQGVLIVGGGNVALRKAILYSEEGAHVHIISKEIKEELKNYTYTLKEIEDSDLKEYFFIYAATDDKELNHHIVEVCHKKGILVGSANEDEDATMKSVSYYKHELGTLAFSSNSSFPYMLPILKEMSYVLDDHKERLKYLKEIRNALKNTNQFKEIVEDLYQVDMDVLKFIKETLIHHQGYVYLHHHVSDAQNIKVNLNPSMIISLKEVGTYKPIFNLLPITYIPLVVSEGNILNKMNEISNTYLRPLIENEEDLKKVLSIFKKENNILCVYLHPRKHLTYAVNSSEEVEFHLLTENVKFNFNHTYDVISFLMNHGNHYKQIQSHITSYNENGFRVNNLGVLSDHKDIIEILEEKNIKGKENDRM